ncbi:MAG TPA: S9 family peptidase [Anaerolineales bacterium]|nr:S9 family peptidase [Anaerolineales bacterium]
MKKNMPYGSWKSPITPEMVAAGSIHIEEIQSDGESIYWLENRPEESGRIVVMKFSNNDGEARNIIPEGFNVRSRVHEYGGGAYTVNNGIVYFCNFNDQRIYAIKPGGEPTVITPAGGKRFADLLFDPKRNRIVCVCEDHEIDEGKVINSIVSISMDEDHQIIELAAGHDFFSNPRISPDGGMLCWLSWDHPNLPWDGSDLWVGSFDQNGSIYNPRHIAGGRDVSIFQPEWSPGEILHFMSDQDGWWNPFSFRDGKVRRSFKQEAEYGLPQWVFGLSIYGFFDDSKLICSIISSGKNELVNLNIVDNKVTNLSNAYCEFSYIKVFDQKVYFVGSSVNRPAELVQLDLKTGITTILQKSGVLDLREQDFSNPKAIDFPSMDHISHGIFYSPRNTVYESDKNEKPPLIVMIHGGPTSAASMSLSMKIQYWTSRGFAVLDVNYSGSTGYGRDFRKKLNGQWGILDVQDCINGALYLAETELVDRNRMSISGGSAGGYTTLCALTFHDVFSLGVSRYGVSSLKSLADDTHKFESHYLESLVGPYSQNEELLTDRSPINFIEKIKVPILIMQGSEDRVVPPSQSEILFQFLDQNHIPVAYILFQGEQHGFRKAETIERALEIEYYFYSKFFGFSLPKEITPVEIRNL